MSKIRRFRSCACASYHVGICSPVIHFVVSNDSVSGQWRSWSGCADAQPDQDLRCPHMPDDMFSHAATPICHILCTCTSIPTTLDIYTHLTIICSRYLMCVHICLGLSWSVYMCFQDSRHRRTENGRDAQCTYSSEIGTIKIDRPYYKNAWWTFAKENPLWRTTNWKTLPWWSEEAMLGA